MLAYSILVHSAILSSHLSVCLPLLLFLFNVPCRTLLNRKTSRRDQITFVFVSCQELVIFPNGCFDLSANILISGMVLARDVESSLVATISKDLGSFLLLCCQDSSPTGIQNMDMTRSTSLSALIQKTCRYLSMLALALSELQWLLQPLRERPVWSLHLRQLFQRN